MTILRLSGKAKYLFPVFKLFVEDKKWGSVTLRELARLIEVKNA